MPATLFYNDMAYWEAHVGRLHLQGMCITSRTGSIENEFKIDIRSRRIEIDIKGKKRQAISLYYFLLATGKSMIQACLYRHG